MSHINKLSSKRNPQDLSLIYTQTKQLEKGMQTALEKLTFSYQNSLEQIKNTTGQFMETVKLWEGQVIDELDRVKNELANGLNEKWKQFKDYGRKVRKSYLGEQQQQQVLSFYPLHEVNEVIRLLDFQLTSFKSLADSHEDHCCDLKQSIRQLKITIKIPSQPQEKTQNISAFPQISPIKPNLRFDDSSRPKAMDHIIAQLSCSSEYPQNQEQHMPLSTFKTQSRQLPEQKENKLSRRSKFLLKESRSTGALHSLFNSPPPEPSQTKSPPLSRTKRTLPVAAFINHSKMLIGSLSGIDSGLLKKLSSKRMKNINQYRYSEDTFMSTRPKNSSRQVSGQKSVETPSKIGYKNCLQRLHKQQMEYDRLRKGIS